MNDTLLDGIVVALSAGVIGYLVGALRASRRAAELGAELAEAKARIAGEEQQRARTAELLAQSEAQVRAAIEGASRLALDANSETFLKLAREVFGRDQAAAQASLKEREVAIAQLLEPIKEGLRKQEEHAQNITRDYGRVSGQIESLVNVQALLQRETRNLSTALKRPEVRGRWGEITLRRVVELAGLAEHCDFEEQVQVSGGALRPDLLVRMPESRTIVVDAKTPLDAYLEAVEAQDDDARRVALRRHASQVEQRIRELGTKAYWEQFEHSPEFAVLFLPGDQFLSAALSENSELIESALKQRIIVTTPSTLMALLKVIAYGWRQNLVTENAREIRKLGEDLHKRLNVFVGHLQKVSKSLGTAVDSFNASIGSMERNVLPQARKFTDLGVGGEPLPSVDQIEELVRLPASESKPAESNDQRNDETKN